VESAATTGSSVWSLPLDDGAVNVVWASEVLAFVPDSARVLSEVRRVLRRTDQRLDRQAVTRKVVLQLG